MDGFVCFQGEFQAAAGLCHLAGAVHTVFLRGEALGRTGSVCHGKGPGIRARNGAANLFRHFQRELVGLRFLKIKGTEDVQAEGPPLGEDPVTDIPGRTNAVHKTVALGKAVGRVQLLAGRDTAAIQRILQKLVVLPLPHILGQILDGGGLVVDQVIDGCWLTVEKRVCHHLPESVGPAVAVRVLEDTARLNDDPVLGPQVAVLVVDALGPVFQGHVLTPAGERPAAAAHLCQTVQQVQKELVGLIDHVLVAGGHGLRIHAPHGGVIAAGPAR